MEFDLVVRNGTVVTASDAVRCDIGVSGEKIVALAESLPRGRTDIDAAGRIVAPGGIDSHCHIDQRSSMGITTADDFYSGGISAACGGITTLIPFAAQHRGESLAAAVEAAHRRAEGKAFVDYSFHMIVSDPSPQVLEEELPALVRSGHPSLKIYLTYDALRLSDRQALQVLEAARREGALVMVHAEHHDGIAWLTERLLAEAKTAPRCHALARPPAVEREAVERAVFLSGLAGAAIMVVHVSGAEALEPIRRARERGLPIFAETCPQYLVLTAESMDLPGFEGAKFMCSPPLRDKADQDALWRGLADGFIQVWSSDHAPYRYDDPQGKKLFGDNAPFHKIPNGLPGLETSLPILFSEGVNRGRISLQEFAALSAANAARIYGLYPKKGTIAAGSDADIAIWDPDLAVTITHFMLHDRMDYSPYEGMCVRGWPVITIARGEVIQERGKISGVPGRGRFLPRGGGGLPRAGIWGRRS